MNPRIIAKKTKHPPVVLSIAGSDPSGGAGIQGDIKAIEANGAFAMSVITAITAQNSQGVSSSLKLPVWMVKAQISTLFEDFQISAIKAGMLSSKAIVECVAKCLQVNPVPHFILDPVLQAKDGTPLLQPNAIEVLKKKLIPLCTLFTPNLPEAETFIGKKIRTMADAKEAAKQIQLMGCPAVLIKGGHFSAAPGCDLLHDGEKVTLFKGDFIETQNTHGTGCTYASAIAAQLAHGKPLIEAISAAKTYMTETIRHALPLGKGHGPTHHFYFLRSKKD